MEAKGYNYSEITVDGQVIGTWSKPTQPSTQPTVRLYRIENKNIPYDESREGIVSKKEIVGGFFTDNIETLSNYIRKNQSQEGINLVYVDISKDDLDKYHVSKNEYAKNMDVESDNWIIPSNINRNYIDISSVSKVTGNFMTLSKAKQELKSIIDKLPSTQPTELTEDDFDLKLTDQITILESELAELEDMKQGMLERSIPVLIATNLPKIKPDSARRETGVGVGTAKDINPGMLSNNGVSVERAAEILNEDLFYEGSGFPEVDVQDIRNYIIDILQTGVKNFVDEFTDQNRIDNIKNKIAELKQEKQNATDANTGIQLNLFGDMNAPEGYPSIPRTPKNCK
jgi:hypothetical protein